MSTPIKKKPRQPWGWGKDGDQPNPFTKLGKQVVREGKETLDDLRDEPSEVPRRLPIRLRDLMFGRRGK